MTRRTTKIILKHTLFFSLYLIQGSYPVTAQIFPFKNYTAKEELNDQQITAIIKDERGLLWIGTPFGINWYDGTHFYQPEIQARTGQLYVNNFYKDRSGAIWILTFYNGLYLFNNGKFTNYLPDSVYFSSTHNTVFNLLQYNENNYVAVTDGSLFWFDKKSFTPFDPGKILPATPVSALSGLRNGTLLLGSPKGLLICTIKDRKLEGFTTILKDHAISQILVRDKAIWIATNKGLYQYSDENALMNNDYNRVYLKNMPVATVAITPGEEVWIGSDKAYKIAEQEISSYDEKNGLPNPPAYIYHDPAGITWFVSTKGLSSIAYEYFKFYDLTKGLINSMTIALGVDRNNDLWLGTFDGIARKTKNGFDIFRTINGNKLGYTSWMLKTKSGQLLAGTSAGIIELNSNSVKMKFDLVTTRSFEDSYGRLWLGTDDGNLYIMENDSLNKIVLPNYLKDFIDAIQIDINNDLWLGYRGYGIVKYHLEGLKPVYLKEFSAKNGFPDLRIRSSSFDKTGNVIFGTRTNGVYIFSVKDDRHWHINSSKGLSANWVKSISSDDENNIYLATNKGINILKNADYSKPQIIKPVLTNKGSERSTNALLINNDTIWAGTDEGLLQYFPEKDLPDTTHPPVYFTKITVNNKPDSGFKPYSIVSHSLQLAHNHNIVAFEFAGVDHKKEGLRYSYYLEGQDKEWSEATERNFVSYQLPPGNYTFKVKAINKDGVSSVVPATISFTIKSPFWKQPWFILLCLVFIGSLFYLLYKYRINQLVKLEKLRSRISSDLHDDIGSTLSSISILSEVAINEDNKHHSKQMINEIKENSILLMEKMDDIIWSVNPAKDSIGDLLLRIKRFAGQLFEAKNIDYTIDIDERLKQTHLSMEYRQHIYLIIKEAINNLVKYSGCTHAAIEIKDENGILKVTITDNGKGFNAAEQITGNGLLNMKTRSALIGAQLTIDSHPGEGTKILLRSKIK